MRRSVTPGAKRFDNRAMLARMQAQDDARRRALMERLATGKPAEPTQQERILQRALSEIVAALQAAKNGE